MGEITNHKLFDGIKCDGCGAVLGLIPIFELNKFVFTGYHKNGMVKKPTDPYAKDEIAYSNCFWCGNDFSKVISKLNEAMRHLKKGSSE